MSDSGAVAKLHHAGMIAVRAQQRDKTLQERDAKGEDKGDMSEFSRH